MRWAWAYCGKWLLAGQEDIHDGGGIGHVAVTVGKSCWLGRRIGMQTRDTLTILLEALPLVASVTGGFATVTDRDGKRIRTINSQGQELAALQDTTFELARQSARQMKAMIGPSQIIDGADAWVIPVDNYVLSCSNVERIQREHSLQKSLEKALPLIAKVAGGEAVIFDREGRRLASYNPDGNVNQRYLNKISEAAKKAMNLNEPVIGESMSFEGARAVRIPITDNFGVGFNNESSARKHKQLIDEVKKFQYARYSFQDIIGDSEAMRQVVEQAERIAVSGSTVLIYGETGTGKELFAQSIHNASERQDKPFVAINCGAIPPTLIESSLFGYVDGAFTGAKKGGSPGAFEQADQGTIFLDEISEMEISMQTKLLRVLQEREVTRIGGSKPVRINVRVIASTNKDLEALIQEQKFRSDLYYRLNVVQIKVPPLKERISDIPALANNFIRKYNGLLGKNVKRIREDVLDILKDYSWPGNVRELQNYIEHALNMVQNDESMILPQHLPARLRQEVGGLSREETGEMIGRMTLEQILMASERIAIEAALAAAKYKKKETAQLLGISTTTLWRRMQILNIMQ